MEKTTPSISLERFLKSVLEDVAAQPLPADGVIPGVAPFDPATMIYVADAPDEIVRLGSLQISLAKSASLLERTLIEHVVRYNSDNEPVHRAKHMATVESKLINAIGGAYIRETFNLQQPCLVGVAVKDGRMVIVKGVENEVLTAIEETNKIATATKDGKVVLH